MKELTFNIFAVSEAVVFQDDCHRIYTHRHLSHRAVLIFQASPYPEVLRDTFGSQGGSGIKYASCVYCGNKEVRYDC